MPRAAILGGLLAGTGLICAAAGAIAAASPVLASSAVGAPPVGPSTVPRCQTSAVTGKVLTPFDGAAGTFGTVIVLTSKATHRCVVSGRPKVLLFGASGRQLHAAQTSTPGTSRTLVLAPAGRAGASLIWHGSPDEPGSVASQCEQVKKIWVTPTGAAGHVTLSGAALGGGLQICDPPGAFRVGPLTRPPFSF